jgi:hypothetical protein
MKMIQVFDVEQDDVVRCEVEGQQLSTNSNSWCWSIIKKKIIP